MIFYVRIFYNFFMSFCSALTLSVPIPDEERKLTYIFVFALLCGASKGFMKVFKPFLKPFEEPQRSFKIEIKVNF